jgi:hypothetical protein
MMIVPKHLLPSLADWNDGRGVIPLDWIWTVGRAEHALGYCALFWPDFEIVDDFVIRTPFSADNLQGWRITGQSRRLIENAMNLCSLEGAFPDVEEHGDLYEAQLRHLGGVMADMWSAKLLRDFPDRKFAVHVVDDDDDFGVTFHQL